MLLDETGSAAGILARHRRSGTQQHVNFAIRPHSEQPETEPSAKVAKPRVVFTPLLARRKASGEPNFVACGGAIDTLQNELEIEGQLELADHDHGRIIAPQREQIAASDLTFDNEAEPFEEGLDRSIEQRLQNRSPGSSQLEAASDVYVYNLLNAEPPSFRGSGDGSNAGNPNVSRSRHRFDASRTGRPWWRILGFLRGNILDRGDTFSTLSTGRTRPKARVPELDSGGAEYVRKLP